METSLKTRFAQIFSCCPTNLSCPKCVCVCVCVGAGGRGGAAALLAPLARTPMTIRPFYLRSAAPIVEYATI